MTEFDADNTNPGMSPQLSKGLIVAPLTQTSTTTIFSVWDGDWAILEEYTTGNVRVESYVQGYHGLVKTMVSNIYYYQDELGSTSHVASSAGALLEYYKYDLYGKPTYFSSTSQPLNSSTYQVKDLFTGQRWIPELGLYDDRNRFMSPDLGRFLQPDPIGFKGDSSNLYRYCGNDWANRSDPMGLLYGNPQLDRANLQNNQQDQHMGDPINMKTIQVFKPDAFTVEAQRAIADGPRYAQNSSGPVQGQPQGGVPAGFVPHNGPDRNQVTSPIYSNKKEVYQTREWQLVDSHGNPFKAHNSLTNTETAAKNVITSTNVKLTSQGIMTDKIAISKAELARAPDGPINFTVKNTANWDGNRYPLSTQFRDTIMVKDHQVESIQSKPYESY